MHLNIRLTRLEQSADSASLQFVGTMADDNGQYFSCSLTIKQEDLPDGQTLDGIKQNEILAIAKAKLASYLK